MTTNYRPPSRTALSAATVADLNKLVRNIDTSDEDMQVVREEAYRRRRRWDIDRGYIPATPDHPPVDPTPLHPTRRRFNGTWFELIKDRRPLGDPPKLRDVEGWAREDAGWNQSRRRAPSPAEL